MPRGGNRVGAGRKPKDSTLHAVHGTRSEASSSRSGAAGNIESTPDSHRPPPIEPPKDLTPAERQAWEVLAPAATAAGTLVATTAADFRELCRLHVHVAQAHAEFTKVGWNEYGLKLERAYRGAVQRLEAKMRAFRLAPIGKEIAPPAQEKPKSALEILQAQRAKLVAVK